MTDLVQKIAEAVREEQRKAAAAGQLDDVEGTIRQALADAGGAVAWMIDGEPMLEHEVRSTDAESRNDLLARAIPLFLHPTPDPGRVAELEAQLAESAKCAFEYAAKVGELERQLAESREREGRMREALEEFGMHSDFCQWLDNDVCDCGLDAALAAEKGE